MHIVWEDTVIHDGDRDKRILVRAYVHSPTNFEGMSYAAIVTKEDNPLDKPLAEQFGFRSVEHAVHWALSTVEGQSGYAKGELKKFLGLPPDGFPDKPA